MALCASAVKTKKNGTLCVDSTDPFANTLGYPQPVEEKPLDDQTGDGSDTEDDQEDDDHDDNNNDDDDDDDSA